MFVSHHAAVCCAASLFSRRLLRFCVVLLEINWDAAPKGVLHLGVVLARRDELRESERECARARER